MSESLEGVPRYLNGVFIENILKKFECSEKVKLENYELKPVAKGGDHYSSVMVRIIADYVVDVQEHKQMSLILKTTYDQVYESNEIIERLKKYDIQGREMLMYGHVLNDFHKILSLINDETVFSPRCYYVDTTIQSLVLEDLSVRGYKCADRIQRLDISHAKLALQKLAKFHACSVILKKKEPGVYEKFYKAFLGRGYSDGTSLCLKHFEVLLKIISKWQGYEYYVIKLTKFKDIFIERGIELYEQSHEDINVLLHGDFWTNNMMFKYDHDGNPVDVLFMDYQLPYYSSPAFDILYFIHTSLKEEIRLEKQNELVQHYYKHLKETLIDSFKYDGKFPSLHEFQVIILKKSLQIFFSAFIIQPLMILDEKIKSNMFLLLDKNEKGMKFAEAMYSNPQVATAIKNLLPVLDAKGIFD